MDTWRCMYAFPLHDGYDSPMERLRLDGHVTQLLQLRFSARILHAAESRFRFWSDLPQIVGMLLMEGTGGQPAPRTIGLYLEETVGAPILGGAGVLWDVRCAKVNSANPRQPDPGLRIIPCYGPRVLLADGGDATLGR